MKNLILGAILLCSSFCLGQSEYNNKTIFVKENYVDSFRWTLFEGTEFYILTQQTGGYMMSMSELLKVLKFYNFDIDNPTSDRTILCSTCKSIYDWSAMSNGLKLEEAEITRSWQNHKIIIIWNCTKETNIISITNLNP